MTPTRAQQVENLTAALKIIHSARLATATNYPVWLRLKHASDSLERQTLEIMNDLTLPDLPASSAASGSACAPVAPDGGGAQPPKTAEVR